MRGKASAAVPAPAPTSGIPLDDPKRLPALFPVQHAIFDDHMERIKEDMTGFLEADAVLALVGEVFGLIPLEPDPIHCTIVITIQ